MTWTQAAALTTASASQRTFDLASAFAAAGPRSRYLQVRVTWSSVSNWAPVLTGVWVEYAAVHAPAKKRRWELAIDARDGKVRRDGGKAGNTGRQDIAAVWDAWELGTPLAFEDIDNDSEPVTYSVLVEEIEEKSGKPGDAGRWGNRRSR